MAWHLYDISLITKHTPIGCEDTANLEIACEDTGNGGRLQYHFITQVLFFLFTSGNEASGSTVTLSTAVVVGKT